MCRSQITIALILSALAASDRSVWGGEPAPAERPAVLLARLSNDSIGPVTARYLQRAIERAEQEQAQCLIIQLDTPGGLVDSTRDIVKAILGSRVPVVVYVAPPGARAASAGVFVTQAAHVAAMAPGTNIGAAHPVQIGGLPGMSPRKQDDGGDESGGEDKTPMEEKIVNDTVAWARSLAELRGRNADWTARAVRESLSAPASEALAEDAVDLMADNLDDLLTQLDGREVILPQGSGRLRTANADVRPVDMWWAERLLALLTNPNLAILLLMFGFYGMLFELYSPGWGVAGTLGIVCLLLGFFGLALLPINYAGLALVAVALALFVAEVFVVSYGALTVAGVVCLVLGGSMLVDSPAGFQRVSLSVLVPVALASAAITFFLVGSIVRAHRSAVQTGSQGLIQSEAVAQEDFQSHGETYTGTVRAQGELWSAVSSSPIASGQAVEVLERKGLVLRVHPGAAGLAHSEGRMLR